MPSYYQPQHDEPKVRYVEKDEAHAFLHGKEHTEGHQLSRQQIVFLSIIGVLGLGITVLGFVQFSKGLLVPMGGLFGGTGSGGENASAAGSEDSGASQDIYSADPKELRSKDTDSDGLNDFDELYVYGTSPYLDDTDSDGYDDKTELETDNDPNCPKGENCFRTEDEPVTDYQVQESLQEEKVKASNPLQMEQALLKGEADPADLREILLSSGKFTEEQISQIDDQTLIDVYNNTLKENNLEMSVKDLTDTSPDRLRALLIEQGFSAEELSQFDDETLQQMYTDALEEARQAQNQEKEE